MCGICGQVRVDGRPVERGTLEGMCRLLEHRGPTRAGSTCDGPVGLGIQRLRVIDLETGDQPIYNEDGSVAVVLNGEIYNYRELREELAANGPFALDQGRHRGDRPSLRGPRPRLRASGCTGCSRSPSGTPAGSSCCSPATGSARSRCSTRCATGALSFASELQSLLQDPEIPREVDHHAHRLPT